MLDLARLQRDLQDPARWQIEQFDRVPSTMDTARERAAAGATDGLAVIAEEQTAGRGRMGRSWISPPGLNLYFTLLLRTNLPILRRLPYLVPLAVACALEELDFRPAIKWPNDIQVNGLKIGGVLIDSLFQGPEPNAVLVGIGLNVNLRPSEHPEIASLATSLAEVAGHPLEREGVLAAILNALSAVLEAPAEETFDAWRTRLSTLGQRVRLRAGEEIVEGQAVDVDNDGSLVLALDNGTRRSFAAGEVYGVGRL